jgi:aminoglycoside phosphotransferase (APT) family kinase protein
MGEAADLLPSVLQEVVAQSGVAEAAGWVLQGAHLSGTQVAVLMVGAPGQPAAAVVKMPATPDGVASQRREAEALAALRAEPSLGDLAGLLPGRLAAGELGGVAYTVERAIPGVEGRVLLGEPSMNDKVVTEAAGAIGRLHEATSASVVVDEELLERWVGSRVRRLAPATRNVPALQRLERLLRGAWEGRRVDVAWVHGDFWPANVIFDPALEVAGIIDWEWAAPRELPAHDLVYLAIHMRMRSEGRELGPVVRSFLTGDAGVAADRETLLLVWLRHVAYNLTQSPGDARNWIWTSRNVESVLRLL